MFTPKDNRYPLSIPTPKNGARPPRFNSGRATRSQQQNQKKRRQDKFTGLEDALGDYTYTLGHLQAENFATTTKAISNYVGKTYKNGGDVKRSIDQLRTIDIPQPTHLHTATPRYPQTPATQTQLLLSHRLLPFPLLPVQPRPRKGFGKKKWMST